MIPLFLYFLRLGATGFGGPLALIAQMQMDLVDRDKWISKEEFLQVFALIKSMPGPVAFQVAVYLGNRRGGFWGGTLAGIGLILPAFFLVLVFAIFYETVSEIPAIKYTLMGMQATALVLVLLALKSLVNSFLRVKEFWIYVGLSLCALIFLHTPEVLVILAAGLVAIFYFFLKKSSTASLWLVPLTVGSAASMTADPNALERLILICLKAGALTFGTGIAIIPMLENDFVKDLGWLTHSQFMDALAIGQMTPGPISVTVTFIGYKVLGMTGAVLATIAIFLPAYVHISTWFPRFVNRLSRQKWISSFTVAVTGAVAAGIFLSVISLGQQLSVSARALALFFLVIAWRWKVSAWVLILAGGLIMTILYFLGL